MPKSKRRKPRAGGKKPGKKPGKRTVAGAATPEGGQAPPGVKGGSAPGPKAAPKTYGTKKSSRSSISPMMSRRSTRKR